MARSFMNSHRVVTRKRPALRPQAESLEGRQLLTAGDLDPDFGTGGSVLVSPRIESRTAGYSYDGASGGVVIQSDGKIVVAGYDNLGDWGLVRLKGDNGGLDPTFDGDGRVLIPFPVMDLGNQPYAIILQPADGKIVVAGTVVSSKTVVQQGKTTTTILDKDFGVVRYLPDGTPDNTFGNTGNGKVITNISTFTTGETNKQDGAHAVALQPDGKILVGGFSKRDANTSYSSMVRYNADGSLDLSFGQSGKVLSFFGSTGNSIKDLAVLPDGKILALGSNFIARYNPDGSLDTQSGFGSGGQGFSIVSFGTSTYSSMLSMALQRDAFGTLESIVVTGWGNNGGSGYSALARFTPAGVLDTSFGGAGTIYYPLTGNNTSSRVHVLPDGKILTTGQTNIVTPDNPNGSGRTLVSRFLPDGSYDQSFGPGGYLIRNLGATGSAFWDSALQPADGSLIAVGTADYLLSRNTRNNDYLVARMLGDAAPLLATAADITPIHQTLTTAQARPALSGALAYWRALGEDTSRLGHIDLAIADLGGNRLGEASGSTITLDDNAAGWGWAVGRRPGRVSPRRALIHEVGHLLGRGHADGGVMAARLSPGGSRIGRGRRPG